MAVRKSADPLEEPVSRNRTVNSRHVSSPLNHAAFINHSRITHGCGSNDNAIVHGTSNTTTTATSTTTTPIIATTSINNDNDSMMKKNKDGLMDHNTHYYYYSSNLCDSPKQPLVHHTTTSTTNSNSCSSTSTDKTSSSSSSSSSSLSLLLSPSTTSHHVYTMDHEEHCRKPVRNERCRCSSCTKSHHSSEEKLAKYSSDNNDGNEPQQQQQRQRQQQLHTNNTPLCVDKPHQQNDKTDALFTSERFQFVHNPAHGRSFESVNDLDPTFSSNCDLQQRPERTYSHPEQDAARLQTVHKNRLAWGNSGLCHRSLMVLVMAMAVFIPTATASCTKGTTELWAYSNLGFEEFQDSYTRYISSSKGATCRWIITSSKDDWVVRLKFDPFQLQESSGGKTGDCVSIYNGEDDDASLLDSVCSDQKPSVYTSEGRHLFVVYKRGKVPGDRKIGFEYQAVDTNSNANLIRIAGIVGGCLAFIGIVYLVVRYTDCCGCLRKKGEDDADTANITGGRHERDRLTVQVLEEGECSGTGNRITTPGNRPPMSTLAATGSTTMIDSLDARGGVSVDATSGNTTGNANSNCLSVSNNNLNNNIDGNNNSGATGGGGSSRGSRAGDGDTGSTAGDSDSDSLHTLNEPPPSYESLYLNDDGEIQDPPPEYTPPRHRPKNPPRRVHTFN